MIRWLLRRFGHLLSPEEINGDGISETYLYRWTLLKTPWGKLYLHHFVGDDWARDLHDHPKKFTSIGLKGSYIEETPDGKHFWAAPWYRTFPAEHRHRIYLDDEECWTLVFVGEAEREWGFWVDEEFVPWRQYVAQQKERTR